RRAGLGVRADRRSLRHAPRIALPTRPHGGRVRTRRPETTGAPRTHPRARTHDATTLLAHPLLAQLLELVLLLGGQDVASLAPRRALVLRDLLDRRAQRLRLLAHLVAQLHSQLAQLLTLLRRELLPPLARRQIGRASCRERVWIRAYAVTRNLTLNHKE